MPDVERALSRCDDGIAGRDAASAGDSFCVGGPDGAGGSAVGGGASGVD